MIITQTSQLALSAAYDKTVSRSSSESLSYWKGNERGEIQVSQRESVSISTRAQWALASASSPQEQASRQENRQPALNQLDATIRETPPPTAPGSLSGKLTEAPAAKKIDDALSDDPKISLIRLMIEMLTGRKAKVFSADELDSDAAREVMNGDKRLQQASQEAANWGAVHSTHDVYEESESSAFAAQGVVRTSDGREISFSLELNMSSYFRQESSTRTLFGAAPKDPLVINFSGGAVELLDQHFRFDLNSDGLAEEIPILASGSGYLFFDRNGDGIVNDGKELFGPATNNGFAELAALDADGNGWIDEADPAFAQLGIWRMQANGESQYTSLKDAGIGALALAHLATPSNLRGNAMQLLGNVRSSSVALTESGLALGLQQIDLMVR